MPLGGPGAGGLAGFGSLMKGLAFGTIAMGFLVGGGPGTLFARGAVARCYYQECLAMALVPERAPRLPYPG